MNGSYLLDTNVVVSFFNGEPEINARLDSISDAETARVYGRVKGELRRKVVSRDGHFDYVDGLRVEAW